MFVANLNNEQQAQLLSLANEMMHADGQVLDSEKEMLNVLQSECSENIEVKNADINDLDSIFVTKKAKVSLLFELIGIALADENYDEEEQQLLKKIATKLDISPQLVDDLELWVKKQFSLIKESQKLMEE